MVKRCSGRFAKGRTWLLHPRHTMPSKCDRLWRRLAVELNPIRSRLAPRVAMSTSACRIAAGKVEPRRRSWPELGSGWRADRAARRPGLACLEGEDRVASREVTAGKPACRAGSQPQYRRRPLIPLLKRCGTIGAPIHSAMSRSRLHARRPRGGLSCADRALLSLVAVFKVPSVLISQCLCDPLHRGPGDRSKKVRRRQACRPAAIGAARGETSTPPPDRRQADVQQPMAPSFD